MNSRVFKSALASVVGAALMFVLPAAGEAATVTLNQTLDLTTSQTTYPGFSEGWRGFDSFSPAFSFDLAAGDTLDWTVMFAPGQSLTLADPTLFWLLSYSGDPATDFTASGTFSLLDAAGSSVTTSNLKTDTEGRAHFGQNFEPEDFTSLPTNATFYGIHYVGTLISYADPTITTRSYADPQVLFSDGSSSTAVPEPAAWALMMVGFGLAGVALRRGTGVFVAA
jgi:hypothetical protein